MQGWNPLDWSANAYLGFHAMAFVACLILGAAIQNGMRPEGRAGVLQGAEDTALLAGGPIRFLQAVATALLADGRLVMADNGKRLMRPAMAGAGSAGSTAAERMMLGRPGMIELRQLKRVMREPLQGVKRDLQMRGLMMDSGDERLIRFTQAAPLFMLLLFGLERMRLGVIRDESIGFLVFFEIATAIAMLLRFFAIDPATVQGKAEVAAAKVRGERLRRAPREPEMAQAVALFGPAALAGTALNPFHQMFANNSSGGCGSDGGGSGCGGGGCGGCGG
ncbi:TIGR04222 domain-containing membrane protein [Croceicoccus sp. Ery5]|uniref:TIGR04222 domain-containing membrane protein n=1 Tax=Croceicoccus sp. Ery5 TaxID=1703340 RepID=UPI001E578AF8|nr:TIGR04222 domain-containing membrane protein [Croceicoccus sp. Ery5]